MDGDTAAAGTGEAGAAALQPHRVPVIDKMMEVLAALERTPEGLSVAALARGLGLARTTVYRLLNTLEDHGVVARRGGPDASAYVLGHALVRMARRVPASPDLAVAARPYVDGLAARLGRTAKLSVRDGDEAVVVAVALGMGPFSISAQVGRRFPLHAGAASKVLLAHAGEDGIARILAAPLLGHTGRTVTDAALLRAELARVRAVGWAADRGEFVEGVRAVAVPIRDATRGVVAALSVTYVAGDAEERPEEVVGELLQSAAALSRGLGG